MSCSMTNLSTRASRSSSFVYRLQNNQLIWYLQTGGCSHRRLCSVWACTFWALGTTTLDQRNGGFRRSWQHGKKRSHIWRFVIYSSSRVMSIHTRNETRKPSVRVIAVKLEIGCSTLLDTGICVASTPEYAFYASLRNFLCSICWFVKFFYRHELLKPYRYYWRYYHLLSIILHATDCLQDRVSCM